MNDLVLGVWFEFKKYLNKYQISTPFSRNIILECNNKPLVFSKKRTINLWKNCHVRLQNLITEDATFDRYCSFVIWFVLSLFSLKKTNCDTLLLFLRPKTELIHFLRAFARKIIRAFTWEWIRQIHIDIKSELAEPVFIVNCHANCWKCTQILNIDLWTNNNSNNQPYTIEWQKNEVIISLQYLNSESTNDKEIN